MSFWTYLLRCADGSYYAGHTDDLERRIAQHQHGEYPGYTHERRPVELVWSEQFGTRDEALAAEMRIKRWSRAKKEALIARDWQALKIAATPPGERAERVSFSLDAGPRLRSGRTEREAASVPPEAASLPPEAASLPQEAASLPRGAASLPPEAASLSPFIPSEVEGQAERSRGPAAPSTPNPPPLIVLVRPQLGQNIGKAARAMLNFGLTEMRLVAPRDGWPNPDAGPAASGADIVLERATVFDSVADAVADCTQVYATTVRRRGVSKPVVTPAEAAAEIHAAPGRTAILFGPERSGLETDDVALARSIVTVPINPAFGSLNLAQAVILVAYEWSKAENLVQPPATDLDPPAPQAELDGMIAQLDAMLVEAGFFFPPDRTPAVRRTLRTLLTKPGWSSQEVRTLRGVLSAFEKPRRRE